MTDAERDLLIRLAEWLVKNAYPEGDFVKQVQPLIDRVLTENSETKSQDWPGRWETT